MTVRRKPVVVGTKPIFRLAGGVLRELVCEACPDLLIGLNGFSALADGARYFEFCFLGNAAAAANEPVDFRVKRCWTVAAALATLTWNGNSTSSS